GSQERVRRISAPAHKIRTRKDIESPCVLGRGIGGGAGARPGSGRGIGRTRPDLLLESTGRRRRPSTCGGDPGAYRVGTWIRGWVALPPDPPPDPALASGPLVGVWSPTPSTMPPLPDPLPPEDAAGEPPLPLEDPPALPPELAPGQLPPQSATPIWLLAVV